VVGGFRVEGATWSTLRWCRKTMIDTERHFVKLSVAPVCMAGEGALEGSWPGMPPAELGLGFFASPGVGEGGPEEGLLWTSSPHRCKM
jgi:hypothetical protein